MSYAFREATQQEGEEQESFSQIIEYSVFNILINGHSTRVGTCSKICKENEKGVSEKRIKNTMWQEGGNFACGLQYEIILKCKNSVSI